MRILTHDRTPVNTHPAFCHGNHDTDTPHWGNAGSIGANGTLTFHPDEMAHINVEQDGDGPVEVVIYRDGHTQSQAIRLSPVEAITYASDILATALRADTAKARPCTPADITSYHTHQCRNCGWTAPTALPWGERSDLATEHVSR